MRTNSLFEVLPDHVMAQCLPLMRPIWFSKKDEILTKNKHVTEIIILTSGEATTVDSDGLPIGWLEPGSVCGEEAALKGNGSKARATVVVTSDRAQVYSGPLSPLRRKR